MNISQHSFQATAPTLPFQVGGPLEEGKLYVVRSADHELFVALKQYEFCYVLAPRQIGKSSLMRRVMRRLTALNVKCAKLDLQSIGSELATAESWYFGLAMELAEFLQLEDPDEFWRQHNQTSPVYRFKLYLRQIMKEAQGDVVIFVDEIDSVLSLPFPRDDFFALIRGIYHARAEEPYFNRLSFCLLGVATPFELIQDQARTPFNIGREIYLNDFSKEEAQSFLPALAAIADEPRAILDNVYKWVCGHPYMMQRICETLAKNTGANSDTVSLIVDRVVDELFLRRGRTSDPNLSYAEKCFGSEVTRAGQMLELYRGLLHGEKVQQQSDNPVQSALKLSGMAAERQDEGGVWHLEVRNPVFAAVFDEQWIKAQEAQRLLAEPLRRWLDSGRRQDELLRGQNLEKALRRRQQSPEAFSKLEHEFIDESVTALRRQESQERQLRNRRTINRILAGALCIVLPFLCFAVYEQRQAVSAKRHADEASLRAEEAALAEKGLRATMLAAQPGRRHEALVVGLQAVMPSLGRHRQPVPQAAEGLFHAADAITLREPLWDDSATSFIESAKYSPDGTRILTTHGDGTARVWDANTKKVLFSLTQPHSGISDADLTKQQSSLDNRRISLSRPAQIGLAEFSPDGLHIITARKDQVATIWNAQTGSVLMSLPQSREIRNVEYSPDGKYLIVNSGEWSSAVHLYDTANGNLVFTSAQAAFYQSPLVSIKFSKDGRYFVAISDWKSLETNVFDANKKRALFPVGRWVIPRSAALSPDGQYAAVSYWSIPGAMLTPSMKRIPNNSYQTAIWNIHSGEPQYYTNLLESLSFSPNGQTLLGIQRNTVQVLATYGEVRLTLDHSNEAKSASFSPDGRYILVTTADQQDSVWLWDADSGRLLCRLPTWGAFSANFSPDGRHIITINGDRTASIWDIAANRLSYEFRSWSQPQNITIAFSPDSKQLMLLDPSANIDMLDLQTKIFHRKVSHNPNNPSPSFLSLSPNGKSIFLGVGAFESSAELRDAQTGNHLRTLSVGDSSSVAQPYAITASYSPDGGRILATMTNGKAYIFDSKTGSIIRVFELPASNGSPYAAFSPNGKQILLATSSEISFWGEGDAPLLKWTDGRQMFRHASYSPDGRRVVVSRRDNTAVIWTPFILPPSEPKSVEVTLSGHQGPVNSAYFSPDGKTVITASDDMTARIWDSRSGQLLYTLKNHEGPLHYATYSPDGRYVLTISRGGGSRVTDISLSSSLTFACRFLMSHWYRHELDRAELAEIEQFCSLYAQP